MTRTLADDLESIINECTRMVLQSVEDVEDVYGDRPIGAVEGSRLEQLEEYLHFRQDQTRWSERVMTTASMEGYSYYRAESWWMTEATRLEKLLASFGGPEAVVRAVTERDAKRAGKALDAMDDLLALPKARIMPSVPVPTPVDILREHLSQSEEPGADDLNAALIQPPPPEPPGELPFTPEEEMNPSILSAIAPRDLVGRFMAARA